MQLRPKGLLSARGRLKVSRRRRPGDINLSGCARNAGRDMKGFWISGKGGDVRLQSQTATGCHAHFFSEMGTGKRPKDFVKKNRHL